MCGCTVCASPGAAEQIGLIRQWNEDLDTLANCGRKLTSGSGSDTNSFKSLAINHSLITYHQRVQRHARSLYRMLREKLESPTCQCGVPHSAHLELKIRSSPPTKALSKLQAEAHSPNPFFTFRVIFSTQQSGHDQLTSMCQELQLELIDDQSCRKTLAKNLCVKNLAATQRQPTYTVETAPTSERGRPVTPSQPLSPLPTW